MKNPEWAKFYFPKRYVFVLLALVGSTSMYAIRTSISVSIVAMVNQTAILPENSSLNHITECPNFEYYNKFNSIEKVYKGGHHDWDIRAQSLILGSYFYGNIATQLLGGILAEKIGAKYVYGGGILMTAIVYLLIPVVASWSYTAVVVVRVIQGLGDGVTFPAINFAISKWSPTNERSRFSAIIFSGMLIGTIIGMPVAGFLSTSDSLGGWPSVFYVFGSIGCIWFLFWCVLIYENPSVHPGISKEELLYIEGNKTELKKKMSKQVWKSMLTSSPVWALAVTHFGFDYGFLILLTELPTYLSTALNFDLKSDGLLSTLPFIAFVASSWLASFLADYLRKHNKMSITAIRKLMTSIGLFGPAIILIVTTFSGCNSVLIIALLCIAMTFSGFALSGYNVTHMDMCPEFAGTLFGITNSIANIAGVLGPLSVGIYIAEGTTLANWSKVFYTAAAVNITCGLVFVIFSSAELQPWATVNEELKIEKQPVKKPIELIIKNLQTKL